ncbi:unannotated protein [freshwater metagenome]|uniref:Unannotated protein n=1 Tax=freshwater metagenome TaxID=449393 RepID=A0A6J7IPW7_9ZZZZ
MTRHLLERGAGRRHELARRVVHLVVAAEEARIVVGHVLFDRGDRDQLLGPDQAVQQLGVVHHLVLAAHLRVLVAERVEAVRAGDDDLATRFLDTLEHGVQGLDVLHRELLEQELVAGTTGGVTGAGLLRAEHHELHAGGREEFGDGLGGLLGAVLVGAGAADPEEVLVVLETLGVLTEDGDVELELGDPVGAGGGVLAPGVALVFQVLEQAGELLRELGLDEDLVATHVEDVVDVFDVDGALLHARTAVGAAPQHLGVDDAAEATVVEGGLADQGTLGLVPGGLRDLVQLGLVRLAVGVDQADLVTAHVLAATGQQVGGLGVAVVA